jgi:hypothetical protein
MTKVIFIGIMDQMINAQSILIALPISSKTLISTGDWSSERKILYI